MEYYAAIDVSLELSSVCVVDGTGKIIREAKVVSEPEALVAFFRDIGLTFTRVGLEAGPLSQWLHAGLTEAGLPAILIETRHVKAALKAMTVKTDRNDARGMAQLMRLGWFRPVHVKTLPAQEIRVLLVGRKLLLGKLHDVELGIRGLLRGFGLKVGKVSKNGYEARIRALVTGHPMLEPVADAMLKARASLRDECGKLHRMLLRIVRHDTICRRSDERAWCRASCCDNLQDGDRRSDEISQIQGCRALFWPDTEEVPIWRGGLDGANQQGWRCDGMNHAV